ncbi:hypothetical protein PR202_gb17590 [Eleusine coracana subsp. coracana]|uniref:Uncharacterized protein n=1 Tax=Eleusine coracana subsp. coracana TaxID=191504 RepID=A0AAV5F3E2_ELECO|nr:hypothetical protein PR202_gb17590 [Eleusine coracana subsp. coracana]
MKNTILESLSIENEALVEKYLRLPTALGRSTKEAFEYMPSKIKGPIGSWSGREASCAGREVLLKSKAQAITTYPMSCFLLPKSTCKKIRVQLPTTGGVAQQTIGIYIGCDGTSSLAQR